MDDSTHRVHSKVEGRGNGGGLDATTDGTMDTYVEMGTMCDANVYSLIHLKTKKNKTKLQFDVWTVHSSSTTFFLLPGVFFLC